MGACASNRMNVAMDELIAVNSLFGAIETRVDHRFSNLFREGLAVSQFNLLVTEFGSDIILENDRIVQIISNRRIAGDPYQSASSFNISSSDYCYYRPIIPICWHPLQTASVRLRALSSSWLASRRDWIPKVAGNVKAQLQLS